MTRFNTTHWGFETAPKRGPAQQTGYFFLPSIYLFLDGYDYKQWCLSLSWWKWSIEFWWPHNPFDY